MIHHDWTRAEVREILDRPFHDLLADTHKVHSDRFDPNEIEGATLVSIKTGGCSQDCAYRPQSARHQTDLEAQALLSTEQIVAAAREAKAAGASRFWSHSARSAAYGSAASVRPPHPTASRGSESPHTPSTPATR